MPETQEEIEIRSDEVQEILSSVPSWMIRWGISLIFIIIMLFLVLSYFIKYPDVIKGTVTLTTRTPPARLVAKSSGELDKIYLGDKTQVKEGDVIAQIRNPLSEEAVVYLEQKVVEVEQGLAEEFKNPIPFEENNMVFGVLQADYNELVSAISEYRLSLTQDQFEKRKAILQQQIANYKQLDKISERQLDYANEGFRQAREKYESNRELYEQNVISKVEFYDQERAFTQAKNEIENLRKTNVQNAITLTDYQRQLNELEYDRLTVKTNLTKKIELQLKNIKNQISSWEKNYVLTAPIDGELNYLSQLAENQFVETGKALFAVVPNTGDDYVGYVQIDKRGYGKIEVGQEVKMKMDNFPSNEYGQLTGTVEKISLIPNEEKYMVQIVLNKGLTSTYNRKLVYTPEMSGQADIITEDLRIIERIFNQLREIFDK